LIVLLLKCIIAASVSLSNCFIIIIHIPDTVVFTVVVVIFVMAIFSFNDFNGNLIALTLNQTENLSVAEMCIKL